MKKKDVIEKEPTQKPNKNISITEYTKIGSAVVAIIIACREIKEIVAPKLKEIKESYNKRKAKEK